MDSSSISICFRMLLDRFGAHQGLKLPRILLHHLSILLFAQDFLFVQGSVAGIQNHVGLEIEDTLQLPQAQVQQMPDPTGQPLEEPDMRTGTGQFDVTQTFPPNLGQSDLDPALVADHSPVLHPLVLPAETLPIGDGAKDLGAEQAVPLRLEGPVVDGLRFGDFPLGPGPDRVRRSQADPDAVKISSEVSPVMRVWSKHDRLLEKPTPVVGSPLRSQPRATFRQAHRTRLLSASSFPRTSSATPHPDRDSAAHESRR